MKNRKWKSLLHKVEYLRLDLEDKEDAAKEIEAHFSARMSQISSEDGQIPTEAPSSEEKTKTSAEVINRAREEAPRDSNDVPDPGAREDCEDRPENMRKIWKSIAMVAHPDKTNNDPRLTDLYKRAARAWDDGKYEELISVALDLGVSTDEADDNAVTLLEARADKINRRIEAIEASVLWQWHKAPQDKKDAIVRLYLAHKRRAAK
jgi:hypothetical protein